MYESEQGAIITYHNGSVWSRTDWQLSHINRNGVPMVEITENGQGRHSDFDQPVRWRSTSVWLTDSAFRPAQSELRYYTLDGNPLLFKRFDFDWDRGTATYEQTDKQKNQTTTKQVQVPPDTLTMAGVPFALRALPFGSDKPLQVHVLMTGGDIYALMFQLGGKETVSTPRGDIQAYRVEASIDVGPITGLFAPEIALWVRTEFPNIWVRYTGPDRGGDVHVTQELAEFSHEGDLITPERTSRNSQSRR
jgi:hypothetical protein